MSPNLAAFLASWSWEPTVLVGLTMAVGLYAVGWARLSRHSRTRGGLASWRAWFYALGLLSLVLALLSPIAAFVGFFLFMHMIQHLLLTFVAPALLLLGAPLVPTLWALPLAVRRAV